MCCTLARAAAKSDAEESVAPRNTIEAYCRIVPATCDLQEGGYTIRRMEGTAGRIAKSQIEIRPAAARNHDAVGIQAIAKAAIAPANPGSTTKGFFLFLAMAAPDNTDPNSPTEAIARGSWSCTSVAFKALTAISGALPIIPSKKAYKSVKAVW